MHAPCTMNRFVFQSAGKIQNEHFCSQNAYSILSLRRHQETYRHTVYHNLRSKESKFNYYINFHGSFILMGLIVPRLTVMKYNECTLYEIKQCSVTSQDSKHFGYMYMYKCSLPNNRQWQTVCSIITFVEGEHIQN